MVHLSHAVSSPIDVCGRAVLLFFCLFLGLHGESHLWLLTDLWTCVASFCFIKKKKKKKLFKKTCKPTVDCNVPEMILNISVWLNMRTFKHFIVYLLFWRFLLPTLLLMYVSRHKLILHKIHSSCSYCKDLLPTLAGHWCRSHIKRTNIIFICCVCD